MLITLSRRAAICQSVAEVYLTGVTPMGAVSHRFNFNFDIIYYIQQVTGVFFFYLSHYTFILLFVLGFFLVNIYNMFFYFENIYFF